jgi:CRP-like cAMP-binding protein
MLKGLSFQQHRDGHFASVDRVRAASAPHTPLQNHLLAALPSECLERLLPSLKPVPLPLGWVIHGAGQREKYLFFITAGIVSRVYVTETGESAAFAFTGNEGVIGVASFLGGESTPSQAVVISPGYAYRLEAGLLKGEFEQDGPLPQLLLRYTQALIAQTGQIVACNGRHSLEQQLCRMILSCLDRLPSNELMMTQELIAAMLGVRRESVTESAGKLQHAGMIHYHRGHIAVFDRPGLEARACECYGVVKRVHDCLLFPENMIGHTVVQDTGRPYGKVSVKTPRARMRCQAVRSTVPALAHRSGARD